MKYMLLMNHIQPPATAPAIEWTPEDAKASGEAMGAIHPVVTDGPFPESKEFLAGYWLIDVESEARAIEIAARTSAAPGPGGAPAAREIQVRPVMVQPDMEP